MPTYYCTWDGCSNMTIRDEKVKEPLTCRSCGAMMATEYDYHEHEREPSEDSDSEEPTEHESEEIPF